MLGNRSEWQGTRRQLFRIVDDTATLKPMFILPLEVLKLCVFILESNTFSGEIVEAYQVDQNRFHAQKPLTEEDPAAYTNGGEEGKLVGPAVQHSR